MCTTISRSRVLLVARTNVLSSTEVPNQLCPARVVTSSDACLLTGLVLSGLMLVDGDRGNRGWRSRVRVWPVTRPGRRC